MQASPQATETMKKFSQKLKKLRKEANMNQHELGDKLNVSQSTIASWETELRIPDVLTLNKLAELFNVTLDELLGDDKTTDKNHTDRDVLILTRRISSVPDEDREFLLNTLNSSIDMYLKAKGRGFSNNSEDG
ncbi:MAG: helix-turn-helix domain-containing protein [Oscillospiraceae bacterium]|nr:helix-turn-helix domain-containing protein [Oscillospiraceae bacterium]